MTYSEGLDYCIDKYPQPYNWQRDQAQKLNCFSISNKLCPFKRFRITEESEYIVGRWITFFKKDANLLAYKGLTMLQLIVSEWTKFVSAWKHACSPLSLAVHTARALHDGALSGNPREISSWAKFTSSVWRYTMHHLSATVWYSVPWPETSCWPCLKPPQANIAWSNCLLECWAITQEFLGDPSYVACSARRPKMWK